jgi:hypothetical protein
MGLPLSLRCIIRLVAFLRSAAESSVERWRRMGWIRRGDEGGARAGAGAGSEVDGDRLERSEAAVA